MEEQNTHLEQTLQPIEEENENQEQSINHDEVEEAPEQAQAQSNKEENLARLREAKEKAERERDQLIAYYKQLEQQQQNYQRQQADPEEPNLGPDDLVEYKYVQREMKKLRDELGYHQRMQEEYTAESRLKSQYADFDQVVNPQNIERLRTEYPELAQTIANSGTDIYSKGASAYQLIKRFNIAGDNLDQINRQQAQNNSAKPRAMNSVSPQSGRSPLDKANAFSQGLTEDLKKSLYKEMVDAAKNS